VYSNNDTIDLVEGKKKSTKRGGGGSATPTQLDGLLEAQVRQYEKQKKEAQDREKELKERGVEQWIMYVDFANLYNAAWGKNIAKVHRWVPEGCQIVD
jgi:hypothetical protein